MSYPVPSPEALTMAIVLDMIRARYPDKTLGEAMDHLRAESSDLPPLEPCQAMGQALHKWLMQTAPLSPGPEVKVGVIVTCNGTALGGAVQTSLAAAKLVVNPGELIADMASHAIPNLLKGWPMFIQLADMPQGVIETLQRPVGGEN